MFSSSASQVSSDVNFIEDVFSTYLYTGNGSTQTITNGIDLAGKGGLVWAKTRDYVSSHALFDTVRGGSSLLQSNSSNGAYTGSTYINPFNSNGFTWDFGDNQVNGAGRNYVSWTFRKQPKFFDVVTYTGNGSNRTIAHSLGSVPGCIMVKRTDGPAQDWNVYHQSLGNSFRVLLNDTSAAINIGDVCWNATTPTSTVFSLGTNTGVNASGGTYVAYIYAHNAGGFGLTGTDNVISCGSVASGTRVDLGYEPQWLLVKRSDGVSAWFIFDNMRGLSADYSSTNAQYLLPNSASAEGPASNLSIDATGFTYGGLSGNLIYIAIRRGPMKVPTDGTKVFAPIAVNNATGTTNTTAFPVDMQISTYRLGGEGRFVVDRLRGVSSTSTEVANWLWTNGTAAEITTGAGVGMSLGFDNTSFKTVAYWNSLNIAYWNFCRAPGFFDEVCYKGTGANTTQTHNLGVVPELVIVKSRNNSNNWSVYNAIGGAGSLLLLNTAQAYQGGTPVSSLTSTTAIFEFNADSSFSCSNNGIGYVAYLFATCPGVSKVGSYTGTGTTQTINCGFASGARFVLIKRTDVGGDWYVWDSARGIVAGNDPYLLLNSTAAEVTSTDYVDTAATGFELSSTAPAALNASGGTYIFLAIA